MGADADHPPVREDDVRAALHLVEHLRQRAEVAGRVRLERDDQRIGSRALERGAEPLAEGGARALVLLEPDELDRQRAVVGPHELGRLVRRAVVDDEDARAGAQQRARLQQVVEQRRQVLLLVERRDHEQELRRLRQSRARRRCRRH